MNLKKNFNFHIFILHEHFALLTLMLMIEAIQEFLGDTLQGCSLDQEVSIHVENFMIGVHKSR